MKKAIVYARVSSNSIDALNAQVEQCIAYANSKGVSVVEIIKNINTSADGSAFMNILDKITTDVVVSNVTRIARDEAIKNEVIQKLNKKNCKLVCIN